MNLALGFLKTNEMTTKYMYVLGQYLKEGCSLEKVYYRHTVPN